jgi:hypothetical protein
MEKKKSGSKKADRRDRIIETLYAELERKDKLIEKLREENKVLVKTALKSAQERIEKKN